MTLRAVLLAAALIGTSPLAFAQNAAQAPEKKPGCQQAQAEPATKSQADGAGGSLSASGWSGAGLGGAYGGTAPAGAVKTSPSFQPVVAKGLDPIKGMPDKPAC